MKKYFMLFIIVSINTPNSIAFGMLEESDEDNNSQEEYTLPVNRILEIKNPTKFAALAHQLGSQADKAIYTSRQKRGSKRPQSLSAEDKLESFENTLTRISQLHAGVLDELDKLSEQGLKPCNKYRAKNVVTAAVWGGATLFLLGMGVIVLYEDMDTETKIGTGVPLATGALGTALQTIEDIKKVIKNSLVDDEITAVLSKIETIQNIKQKLEKDIQRLRNDINTEEEK